jgi:hypothetical protein
MNLSAVWRYAALLSGLACASAQQRDPQIRRPGLGEQAEDIPGPLVSFGPFDDFSDALKAACPLLLSKPHATVTYLQERELAVALRTAKEYCAWLYHTPDQKFELSMLSDRVAPGSALNGEVGCRLPSRVRDSRYPYNSLQHIFILHNHPFSGELSRFDIQFAVEMARSHAAVAEIEGRKVPLSVIAFFSNSRDGEVPSCDGFYQYVPATSEILQWAHAAGDWKKKQIGVVNWADDGTFSIIRAPGITH